MRPDEVLDDAARARLLDRFGAHAQPCFDELPAIVERLTSAWNLEIREARPGNTGRTLMCTGPGGEPRVLKLTPDKEIAQSEATALQTWAHCPRVVSVLDVDFEAGAILLEGLEPGIPLTGRDVPWAEIGDLLTQLHSVEPLGPFRQLADGIEFIFTLSERRRRESAAAEHLSAELLEKGRARAMELATSGPVALIHGDLHPANVLDAGSGRGAVAIDPRAAFGDPAGPLAGVTCRRGRTIKRPPATAWLCSPTPYTT